MSIRNTPEKFWRRVLVDGPDDCWLWQGILNECGNAQWYWKGELRLVHHISIELCLGVIIPSRRRTDGSSGIVVRLSCDIGHCVNPRHLILGTQYENVQDRVSRGRSRTWLKLTAAHVTKMRIEFHNRPCLIRTIAEKYGIHPSWAGRVLNGKAR